MHGPYVLKRWLHGAKRAAVLGHESEPNDEIVAHVDRMVRKKDVPQKLKDAWKPIKLKLAEERQVQKRKGAGKERAAKAEKELSKVDKEVAEEVRRELDDVELALEKVVAKAYVVEGKREGWQYRVRFVGYGAKDDEWYWEEDILKTAPKEVDEFNEGWSGKRKDTGKGKNGRKAGEKKRKEKEGKGGKAGARP